jgi:hypothetical protein
MLRGTQQFPEVDIRCRVKDGLLQRRVRLVAVFLLGCVAASAQAVPADALGSRFVSAVPAIVLTSAPGDSTVHGTMTVVVTETAVNGINPWSVTASMSALNQTFAPPIPSSQLVISARSVTQVGGGGTSTPTPGAENMSTTRTLHVTTGQSALSVYTGTYTDTATLNLSVPNAQPTGQYVGTMTITLVQ